MNNHIVKVKQLPKKYVALLAFTFMFIMMLVMVSAASPYSDCTVYGNCQPTKQVITFNNNTGNFNNSIYWNGQTLQSYNLTYIYTPITQLYSYTNQNILFNKTDLYNNLTAYVVVNNSNSYVPYVGANKNVALGIRNLTTTGMIGIGTTTPSQKLDVRGIGNFSGTVYINNGTDLSTIVAGSGINAWNLSGSNLFPSSLSYNVGIGTNSPASAISAVGSDITGAVLDLRSTATGVYSGTKIFFLSDDNKRVGEIGTLATTYTNVNYPALSANGTYVLGYNNLGLVAISGNISFQTSSGSSTERLRITSSGNVGIGTTNPTYLLHVAGNNISSVIARFDGNISASGYHTTTNVYDASKEINAKNYIKSSSELIYPNGTINHKAFGYSYSPYKENYISGYKTETYEEEVCSLVLDEEGNIKLSKDKPQQVCEIVTLERQIPVYAERQIEAIDMVKEVAWLRQVAYEQQQTINQLNYRLSLLEAK